jgi:hypothetical protein
MYWFYRRKSLALFFGHYSALKTEPYLTVDLHYKKTQFMPKIQMFK